MTVYVIGVLAALVHANRRPSVTLDIGRPGHMTLTVATLFRRRTRRIRPDDVMGISVSERQDQDGDPYFRAIVSFMDDRQCVVADGHHRNVIDRTAAMVSDA